MDSLQLIVSGYAFVALPLFLVGLTLLTAVADLWASARVPAVEAVVEADEVPVVHHTRQGCVGRFGVMYTTPARGRGAVGNVRVVYSLPEPVLTPSGAWYTGLTQGFGSGPAVVTEPVTLPAWAVELRDQRAARRQRRAEGCPLI